MLVVTWNVNSLNTRMDHLAVLTDEHRPDVVCLQETKCGPDNFPHLEVQSLGYEVVDLGAGGREGVAILVGNGHEVTDRVFELDGNPRPEEARWVEATIAPRNGADPITVASVYVVNGRSLDHPVFDDKLEMLDRMADRAEQLAEQGHAIIAGDFNIAPRDEDIWDPKLFVNSTHASPMERKRLEAILETGYRDAWDATPQRGEHEYTWWDYRMGNFHKNKGLRIDLVLMTEALAAGLSHVGIDRELRKNVKERDGKPVDPPAKPSDHAPLLARFDH